VGELFEDSINDESVSDHESVITPALRQTKMAGGDATARPFHLI
jgi:hypothetical protein